MDLADLKHEYTSKKALIEPKAIDAAYRMDAAQKQIRKYVNAGSVVPNEVIDELLRSERLSLFYENELLAAESKLKELA